MKQNADDLGNGIVYFSMCHIIMSPVPTSSAFYFISLSNLFGVLSLGFAVAITRTCIIYKMILKNKEEIGIPMILRDKNFQPVSLAAMLGFRYPMVSTSALHQ